jgi:heat shock protein HslJ
LHGFGHANRGTPPRVHCSIACVKTVRLSIRLYILLSIVSGLLFSCSSKTPEPLTPSGSQLDGTHWRLRHIYRYHQSDIYISDSLHTHYTLEFGVNNVIGGIGDCNRFSGSYVLGLQDTIHFRNIQSTLIGCTDPATEIAYFDGLTTASEYIIDSDELLIYCTEGDVFAMYFYRF